FSEPLGTRTPPPQEELPAEESVTMELADAVSISALVARCCSYSDSQLLGRPSLRRSRRSASCSVPVLMPSLTMNMILRAFFPSPATGRLLPVAERPEKGDNA